MVAPSKDLGLSPWGKAVAGALAAVVANTLVYPLDIAKTKLQVQSDGRFNTTSEILHHIYTTEGLSGCYTGLGGSLLGVASTNFAYFYWYGLIRGLAVRRWGSTISTVNELAVGALAGALAQIFTLPVSVITTRQQTTMAKRRSLLETATDVIEEGGITSLWTGLKASLVLVINPSITYGSFERLRTLLRPGKATLSPYDSFVIGAMSKALATIATQPLIVAKVVQQSSGKKYSGFVEILVHLVRSKGVSGLYRGLAPQISKGVLVQGLLFMFKDQVELLILLLARLLNQRLGVRAVQ